MAAARKQELSNTMQPISYPRIGVIGAGCVAQLAHIAPLSALKGCQIIAVADHHLNRVKKVAEKYGIPRTYTNHTDLLKDDDIDAVVIVTYRLDTPPVVRDALLAGKHVLSEKPMAYAVKEAQDLHSLAQEKGLLYGIGYMKRNDESVRAVRKIVHEETNRAGLGSLLRARFYCHGGDHGREYAHIKPDGPRRQTKRPEAARPAWLGHEDHHAYDRMLNVFSHDVDLARFLLGVDLKPEFGTINGDNFYVSLVTAAGVSVSFEFGFLPFENWHEGVELLFENGKVTLTFPSPMDEAGRVRLDVYEPKEDGTPMHHVTHSSRWTFDQQARDYVDSLQQGAQLVCTGHDGIQDLELVEAIWKTVRCS